MGISNDLRYMDRGRVPRPGQTVDPPSPGRGTPKGHRGELPLQHFAHPLLTPRSSQPHKASTIEHSKEGGAASKCTSVHVGGWGGCSIARNLVQIRHLFSPNCFPVLQHHASFTHARETTTRGFQAYPKYFSSWHFKA